MGQNVSRVRTSRLLGDSLMHLDRTPRSSHARRWITAVPNVAGYPPAISGFPLVNRDVFANVLHGWAARFGIQADRIITPFERPLTQDTNLIYCERELQAKLIEESP